MGIICGPTVASLFVYILEKRWLLIHKPLFYGRFIDDINLISDYKIDEAEFKSYFLNLELNIIQANTINFLDLTITFDSLTKKLKFSLYVKPTNTFCYLQISSNHPNFIFKNIPKCLFTRIKRICTEDVDYWYFARKLIVQLLKRGYNFKKLFALAFTISKIDRTSLLNYKEKTKFKSSDKTIFFGTEFNKNIEHLNSIVTNAFDKTVLNHSLFSNYKLRLYNSMAANLNCIFIHHNNPIRSFYKNTNSCGDVNCKTCIFVNSNNYIMLRNNFFIPIKSSCNCISTNIVYIIKCKLCNSFYIGQSSKTARIRISQHIQAIIKFKPYINFTSEVGCHFNLKGHNFKRDFCFFIFKDGIDNIKERLSNETNLIHIFERFNPPIINAKIPNIHSVNTLCFL